MFVIDGSKSLGEENFEIVKQFVSGILDSLEISPKAARVGLLQYSTEVRTEFTLRQFSSAKDMKKAVSQMKYMGRGSMTGLALKQMFERSFTETEGARPFSANVPRISIVFTDGRAQDEVSEWAARAKRNGKWRCFWLIPRGKILLEIRHGNSIDVLQCVLIEKALAVVVWLVQ